MTLRGAKKRRCDVCERLVFRVWRTPFGFRAQNGRAPGSYVDLAADGVLCARCLEANEAQRERVNAVAISYATKACHRCGGLGRVAAPPGAGRRWQAPAPSTVSCSKCCGTGRVAA